MSPDRSGAAHVVLVGLPTVGKTTVGALVAEGLGCRFVDVDDVIEAEDGRPITAIFAEDGEDRFRDLEERAIATTLAGPPAVIGLGGGSVLRATTRTRLAAHEVVWLEASVETLVDRLDEHLVDARPLLAGGPRERLGDLARARGDLYAEVATHRVPTDGLTAEQVAERVLAVVGDQVARSR